MHFCKYCKKPVGETEESHPMCARLHNAGLTDSQILAWIEDRVWYGPGEKLATSPPYRRYAIKVAYVGAFLACAGILYLIVHALISSLY
jgi:hypothetical protein